MSGVRIIPFTGPCYRTASCLPCLCELTPALGHKYDCFTGHAPGLASGPGSTLVPQSQCKQKMLDNPGEKGTIRRYNCAQPISLTSHAQLDRLDQARVVRWSCVCDWQVYFVCKNCDIKGHPGLISAIQLCTVCSLGILAPRGVQLLTSRWTLLNCFLIVKLFLAGVREVSERVDTS